MGASDGWMEVKSCQDNLPGNCLISGVASCLISSALVMGQVPQQLLQSGMDATKDRALKMVIIVIIYLIHDYL